MIFLKNVGTFYLLLWTCLWIAFTCFKLLYPSGTIWVKICCNNMVILGHPRRNRRLFSKFPIPFYPSHWRSRGFEPLIFGWRLPLKSMILSRIIQRILLKLSIRFSPWINWLSIGTNFPLSTGYTPILFETVILYDNYSLSNEARYQSDPGDIFMIYKS